MACAYHQIILSKETSHLTAFVIQDVQWQFDRGFYGLAPLPGFFVRMMMFFFREMLKQGKVVIYIDDVLIQALTKQEMERNIEEFHKVLKSSKLKADPTKTYFFQKEKLRF